MNATARRDGVGGRERGSAIVGVSHCSTAEGVKGTFTALRSSVLMISWYRVALRIRCAYVVLWVQCGGLQSSGPVGTSLRRGTDSHQHVVSLLGHSRHTQCTHQATRHGQNGNCNHLARPALTVDLPSPDHSANMEIVAPCQRPSMRKSQAD